MSDIQLSPEQLAIRDGARDAVVVAGAGTGKTETLTQRILKLLLEGDEGAPVPLEGVLALTFTDKAAAEMRARVYAGIVARLRVAQNGAQKALLEELRAEFIERNRIGTFDAFNRQILAQFPDDSPLPPGFDAMDEGTRAQMHADLSRAFWAYCDELQGRERDELWEWLEGWRRRDSALEAVSKAGGQDREVLEAMAQLPDWKSWRADLERRARDFAARAQVEHDTQVRDAWESLESAVAATPDVPVDVGQSLLDADRILAGRGKGVCNDKGWIQNWEKKCPPAILGDLTARVLPPMQRWQALAKSEFEAPATSFTDESWQTEVRSRRLAMLLAKHALWWRGARRDWCARHGLADYDDVARIALELLDEPEIAGALAAQISHVVIDEFQDTNWRQWAIIERLRECNAVQTALIVGDEKQAIFRFRGGDITVFDGVRRLLLPRDAPDELSISRRSTPVLVDWVNRTFAEILPARGQNLNYEAPFQELSSGREPGGGAWKLEPQSWTHADEDLDKYAHQAVATARFLSELCADARLVEAGETPLHQPHFADIAESIARGQNAVALLVRTHEVKGVYERALRACGVPFVSVAGRGFYQSEPVQLTLHLARYLADSADSIAWLGLARGPLGGLSDVALLEDHLADGEAIFAHQADQMMATQLRNRLAKWRDLARVLPFSDVLETVMRESDIAFADALTDEAAQCAQNWRRVIEMVRERESRAQGGLRALADYFGALARAEEKEPEAPLPVEASIQLMTVHAAKGLGFPMTILGQCDGALSAQPDEHHFKSGELEGQTEWAFKLKGDEAQEARAPSTPPLLWQWLDAREKAHANAEWHRLFYVACTRARDHLMLVWPSSARPNSWMDLCQHRAHQLMPVVPSSRDVELTAPAPTRAVGAEPRAVELVEA